MQPSDRVLGDIEDLVGGVVRRDITKLVLAACGGLSGAARSIADHPAPHVGIVCGFFVRHAEPPSPETDSLNGMGQLAAGFFEAGIPVTAITDAPCAKAVWAVTRALPGEIGLEVVSVNDEAVRGLRDRLESASHPITHLIAIERCSQGVDGRHYREHGWDISADTAALDYLFEDQGWTPPWVTVGVGDGGNEIGMGALPRELLETEVPNGPLVAARTSSDYPIVAGVANWGAYGLLAGVAWLRPDLAPRLLGHFDGRFERELLTAAVEVGQAIDDSRVDRPGRPQMTVDRLPLDDHIAVIDALNDLLRAAGE